MRPKSLERCFLNLHVGRCGSMVLSSILKQQANVISDGEVFSQRFEKAQAAQPDITGIEFLQSRLDRLKPETKYYGFEIKLMRGTQILRMGLDLPTIIPSMQAFGVDRFIVMHRRNILDRIISQRVALQRGAYVQRDAQGGDLNMMTVPLDAIRVSNCVYSLLDAIRMFEEDTEATRQNLIKAGEPYLELAYEDDILGDPNVAAKKVAEFVGFEFKPVESELRKVVQKSKASFIANWTEIEDTLAGTPYAWMLG